MSLLKLTAKKLSKAEVEDIVSDIVSQILECSNPSMLILFGSAVNHQMTDASDLDIAVIFDSPDQLSKEKKIIYQKVKSSYPIDFVFYDKKTYDSKKLVGGIAQIINEDGRILYIKEQSSK